MHPDIEEIETAASYSFERFLRCLFLASEETVVEWIRIQNEWLEHDPMLAIMNRLDLNPIHLAPASSESIADLLEMLGARVANRPHEEYFWDLLLRIRDLKLPPVLGKQLYVRGIAVHLLARTTTSAALLRELAHLDIDAAWRLVSEAAVDAGISASEFERRLLEWSVRHPSLLESLARFRLLSSEKENILVRVLSSHPKLIARRRLKYDEIAAASPELAPSEIDRFFATHDPHIWRSLAQNPATPIPILQRLASHKSAKFASQIRNAARENLAKGTSQRR